MLVSILSQCWSSQRCFSVYPLCSVHSSSVVKQQTCLFPCSALFYTQPPRDSAAPKQTHALARGERKPDDWGKVELCVESFHGRKWKHCKVQRVEGGHSPLWQYHLFIQMHEKPLFYFTSKKHRYQLTGPVFNWYQNNTTFSQNLTLLVWSASKP